MIGLNYVSDWLVGCSAMVGGYGWFLTLPGVYLPTKASSLPMCVISASGNHKK